ncbi:MAG: nucleotidyl transferase AbiEii/AbiGii toxin family protein [Cytophagales bacterium]|nr:nucleotidyl transferase AbiEii/AbiGii toxin family protein [Cytophagales bacterium]MCA6366556.1 nucleotidyl transferase AbiEii/AbiGii toxin family protein [Cytophagales bacterium]MCA6374026.1 nucleotidyl transferase AbiEii/AbiGii toxin family protein [Cytophagales bacterium]MCA6375147.1 nucleotidyl transferase AbiEii/AbiGii toxin family protein [Cytophagales bacterium]MCA6384220.1 nucleotidyl transferase AbiEii/AbiGii toxin family protein [Cytophagales bacterium]
MKLHENTALFRDAIRFTAQRMNLPPEYIEKDYWVTHVLHTLFIHEIGADTVFKGGTALSKCYKTIDRFSEDIDLVVVRREGESNNKMTTKIKTISDVVSAVLPEVDIEGLTQKMGMNRKTAHTYNKEFKGSYGQVRDVIVVEATWLGYFEPYTTKQLNSFVGEMMLTNNQAAMAEANGLMPFDVRVLEPVRTLCEKIMSLVRFSYVEDPIDDLKNKIRHTYDLHQLLLQQEFLSYFQSNEFPKLLLKVANDDVVSYKNSNEWLAHHPNEALIFKDLDNVWNELKATYNNDFKTLVYGILPPDDSVLEILKMIRERLVGIE